MRSQLQNFIQHESAVKKYFIATRPVFLTASVLPVLVGTAIGFQITHQLDVTAMALAIACIMLVHAGSNVINDVYDDIGGTDRINVNRISPYTGGSRVIQNNILTLDQMRHWGVLLLYSGVVCGLVLTYYRGPGVALLGGMGLLLGVLYSTPPIKLAARGLGESAVALGFGVLPVVGAAWLQTDSFNLQALLLSLPISLWIGNVLLINEIPDMRADGQTDKRTLPVRLGIPATAVLYLVSNLMALAFLVYSAALGYLPALCLSLSFLLFIPVIFTTRAILKWHTDPGLIEDAIKLTLVIHTLNSLWILSWLISG